MATSMDLQDAVCPVYVNQIADLESEEDYMASSHIVSEVVALPSTVLVTGESFCQCDRQEELNTSFSLISDCLRRTEDQGEQKLTSTNNTP